MRRAILNLITALALTLVPAAALATSTAYAACSDASPDAQQVLQGVGQTGSDCSEQPITNVFKVAVQILSIIAGVAGIIMVILGGFRYTTSGGDAGRVGNAKNTLIYALIGLAIAALAQLLVHFVLFQTTKATNTTPANPTQQATPSKKKN